MEVFSLGKVKSVLQGVFSLHLTANDHPNPYTAKLPCSFTHAGRPEGWQAGSTGTHASLGGAARSPPPAPTLPVCGACGAGKTFPVPPRPQPRRPLRDSAVLGAWRGRAAGAPSLPGRRGAARQGGRESVWATRAAAPSRPARAGIPRLLLEAAAWGALASSEAPRGEGKLEITKKQMCLESPPPTAIHNPADRKRWRVTSCCLPRKRSPPDRVAGTFVSRFGCRLGWGRVRKELPSTDRVAGRSGELWRGFPPRPGAAGTLESPRGAPAAELRRVWAPPCWGGKPHNLRAVACGSLTAPPVGRTVFSECFALRTRPRGDWVRGTLKPLSKGSGDLSAAPGLLLIFWFPCQELFLIRGRPSVWIPSKESHF